MRRWACLAVLLGACERPVDVPIAPVSLVSDDVWSGSELRMTSPGFVPSAARVPVVLLDADTLALRRLDDTTFVAPLPDRPGPHALRVRSPLVLPLQTTVTLRGFLNSETGPGMSGRTEPGIEPTELFGSGPDGLRRWNVATGETFDYPDTLHMVADARGVGPGIHRGHVVLQTRVGGTTPRRVWMIWRMWPNVVLVDTMPSEVSSDRFVAALAFRRYAFPASHWFLLRACDGTPCAAQNLTAESGFDVVRSPRGDRAALLAHVVPDSGAPIVDIASGTTAYFVPPLRSATGAAFTGDGDTLFLAGNDRPAGLGVSLLLAVRASDGQLLVSDTLSYRTCGAALDQSRPWLYVAGIRLEGPGVFRSVLGVFDRRTLAPITMLHVPGDPVHGANFPCRILPSSVERRVYVIDTFEGEFHPTMRASFVRFDTPP